MISNEEKAIEATIRFLEDSLKLNRKTVNRPEIIASTDASQRIDASLVIGDQAFGIEHTQIEPFENFNRLARVVDRISKILKNQVEPLGFPFAFELLIPADFFDLEESQKSQKVRAQMLADFLKEHFSKICEFISKDTGRTSALGVLLGHEILFSETFLDDVAKEPNITILVQRTEDQRFARISRAMKAKVPKLVSWCQANNAKSVLILSNRDIQLTSWSSVYEVAKKASEDLPVIDYLLYLSETTSVWRLFPFLQDGHDTHLLPDSRWRNVKFNVEDLSSPFSEP